MNTVRVDGQSYGKPAKWLHWGMALLVVVLISVGTYMTGLDKSDPSRLQLTGMHRSFGVIFMQLAILRLIWNRINRSPPLPEVQAGCEGALSCTLTASLYVLMLAIPFSGFAMTNFAGYPVSMFGLTELPQLFGKNPELAGLAKPAHGVLVCALMLAICMHLAATLKHHFLVAPGADVLPRMIPLRPHVQACQASKYHHIFKNQGLMQCIH